MSSEEDASDLLRRIARRDETAMLTFYDRYFGLVAGYCRKVLGGDADEVIQDTFWQVWRRADQYDPDRAGVPTWLLLIARSRTIDALRRRGREMPFDPLEQLSEHTLVAPDDVPQAAETALEVSRVREAFHRLPSAQRTVLSATFFGGKTTQQIATQESVPVGTVKTRLRLALKRLRTELGGD